MTCNAPVIPVKKQVLDAFTSIYNSQSKLWQFEPTLYEQKQAAQYYDARIQEEKDAEILKLWQEAKDNIMDAVNRFMLNKITNDFNEITNETSDKNYFKIFQAITKRNNLTETVIKSGKPYVELTALPSGQVNNWTTLDVHPDLFRKKELLIGRDGLLETSIHFYNMKTTFSKDF